MNYTFNFVSYINYEYFALFPEENKIHKNYRSQVTSIKLRKLFFSDATLNKK
jgi:hypothetical protein